MRTTRLLVPLGLAALTLTACGGDGTETTNPGAVATSVAAAESAAALAGYQVDVRRDPG